MNDCSYLLNKRSQYRLYEKIYMMNQKFLNIEKFWFEMYEIHPEKVERKSEIELNLHVWIGALG